MLPRGQIFYDASCGICSATYRRFGPLTERLGFRWVPAQDPRARELLGLEDGQVPDEVKLQTTGGRMLGGADALLHVARAIWWGWPLWAVSRVPGMSSLFRALYRKIATNRHAISGTCGIDPSQPPLDKAA